MVIYMSIFTGAGVAIVTPMNEDGSINFEKLGEHIEYQIAHKTDSIIICGTTGESATMTHEEHLACIKFAVEKVAGRIPVVAGTGSNCTDTAIYLSTEAEKYGADALLVVTPYYNKATQNGLVAHFTKVADSVNIPIILYNVPSRTGCNILPETAIKIAKKSKNVVAIKEASGNMSQVAQLATLVRKEGIDFDIYSKIHIILLNPILTVMLKQVLDFSLKHLILLRHYLVRLIQFQLRLLSI